MAISKVSIYYGIIALLVLVAVTVWFQGNGVSHVSLDTQTGGSCENFDSPEAPVGVEQSPVSLSGHIGPEKPCATPSCQLQNELNEERKYAQNMIEQYRGENFKLKHYLDRLLKKVDEASTDVAYRKRLSNEFYKIQPHIAYFPNHSPLNLREDDFSNKTFSESKFLAPTQTSSFYGDDVHSGSYLCDDLYPYTDRQTLGNYQIEVTPQTKLY